MGADEGTAVLQPRLERGTLRLGEHVAAGVVPDHQLEAPELLGIHHRGILGDERRPSALLRDRHKRVVRGLDRRLLAVAVGLREDQDRIRAFDVRRDLRRHRVVHRRDESPASPRCPPAVLAASELTAAARRQLRRRLRRQSRRQARARTSTARMMFKTAIRMFSSSTNCHLSRIQSRLAQPDPGRISIPIRYLFITNAHSMSLAPTMTYWRPSSS